jgi:hypothetical protein
VYIENQGSSVVRVKHTVLNPGDHMVIPCPPNGNLIDTLRIKFLASYNFAMPLATYPQLYNGNRLQISQTIEKDPL